MLLINVTCRYCLEPLFPRSATYQSRQQLDEGGKPDSNFCYRPGNTGSRESRSYSSHETGNRKPLCIMFYVRNSEVVWLVVRMFGLQTIFKASTKEFAFRILPTSSSFTRTFTSGVSVCCFLTFEVRRWPLTADTVTQLRLTTLLRPFSRNCSLLTSSSVTS